MSDRPGVALIGLGNMGLPMSARISGAGFDVAAFDASEAALARAASAGVRAAASAAEAVNGARVVILMLPNSAIVTNVIDGLMEESALAHGTTVIDMSSSEPVSTRALAERLASIGVRMIDAPVSGGVRGAENGTLTIMVGGDGRDISEVRPVLDVLGTLMHAGPIGAGHAVKALNNMLSATHLWATSEAIEVGRRFGLDAEAMLAIFNGSSGRSGSTEVKWPKYIVPGSFDSGFKLQLMLKDMRIALGLAQQVELGSRLGERAVELWAAAGEGLSQDADHTEIARWIEQHPEDA